MITTIILTVILCFIFWGCCYLCTGGDEKNIKAYATYPDKVQAYVRNDPQLKKQIEKANLLVSPNPVRTFLATENQPEMYRDSQKHTAGCGTDCFSTAVI